MCVVGKYYVQMRMIKVRIILLNQVELMHSLYTPMQP